MNFDPERYGSVFANWLAIDRCRPLDAGSPPTGARQELLKVTPEAAFAPHSIADPEMASACLSGVWLLYDLLDDSHALSQNIDNSTGSFWHGIMHRREGDYSNAKYWFRNVGRHPVYEPLAAAAAELAELHAAQDVLPAGQWDPMKFVDACQIAVRTDKHGDFCRAVQQAEWELLFDYCYRSAVA